MSFVPGGPYWYPQPEAQSPIPPPNYGHVPYLLSPSYASVSGGIDPTDAIRELWQELGRLRTQLGYEVALRDSRIQECERRIEHLEKQLEEIKSRQQSSANPSSVETEDVPDPHLSSNHEAAAVSVRCMPDWMAQMCDSRPLEAERREVVDPPTPSSATTIPCGPVNGDLYLFGGFSPGNVINDTVEVFEKQSGFWKEVHKMHEQLTLPHNAAVGHDNGTAFFFSAFPTQENKNPIFKYDRHRESEDAWTKITPSTYSRCMAAYNRLGDAICVSGGYASNKPILWSRSPFPFPPDLTRLDLIATVELFDPGRDCWTFLPSLLKPVIRGVLVSESNHVIYSLGGLTFGSGLRPTDGVTRFDLRQGRWEPMHPMTNARVFFDAVRLNDHSIVAMGGISATISDSPRLETSANSTMEIYDCRNNSWMHLPSMQHNRCFFTSHVLNETEIYVIGGQRQLSRGQRQAQALGMDKYVVDQRVWTESEMLAGVNAKRFAHASCIL